MDCICSFVLASIICTPVASAPAEKAERSESSVVADRKQRDLRSLLNYDAMYAARRLRPTAHKKRLVERYYEPEFYDIDDDKRSIRPSELFGPNTKWDVLEHRNYMYWRLQQKTANSIATHSRHVCI